MVVVGSGHFGKVDHVPGLFFVKTHFMHICWFPLVPAESHLILDDDSERAIKIPFRWKSLWIAWARASTLGVALGLLIVGALYLVPHGPRGEPRIEFAAAGMCWLAALPFLGLLRLSFRLTRASLERAIELGRLIEVPPEVVESLFHKAEWEWLEASRREDAPATLEDFGEARR